ncbi:MAG: tryptophan synthase subunit alpha [Flavobacteriales bacterium]
MNAIEQLFKEKNQNILNIYFTAGYPELNHTQKILTLLDQSSVDLIEIGFPYSDPLADGFTIQESSSKALKNGITIQMVFDQVASVKEKIKTPLIAMGYYNQFLQFGEENFLLECSKSGISGVILPDLPVDFFLKHYQSLFEQYNIAPVFLITPQTSDERIKMLAKTSKGFLYVVSSASTTGKNHEISFQQKEYFKRIKNLQLDIPYLIGFGIHDKKTFETACKYANGAIIGSAFIKAIKSNDLEKSITNYVQSVKKY